MMSLTCGILKENTNEMIYKIEIDSQTQKTNLWLPKGKGGGINWVLGINRYALQYIIQINKKALLYSTGNHIQHILITYNGKETEKESDSVN